MSDAAGSAVARALRSEMALAVGIAGAVGLTVFVVDYPLSIPGAGLAAITCWIARTDWRERIIPNPASLAAAALGVAEALISAEPRAAFIDALTRGGVMFLLFFGFRFAYRFWRGREGMGLGDVKLAGVLGLWLEWPYIPVAVELACLSAIAYVLVMKIVAAEPVNAFSKLPFGAFFAPAIWVTWTWANGSF